MSFKIKTSKSFIISLILFWTFYSFSAPKETLFIYSYDSFLAKGGLGETLIPLFSEKSNCTPKMVSVGDAGGILARLKIDQKQNKLKAHVVIGLDQFLWQDGKDFFENWIPRDLSKLKPEIKFEPGFLPYDYGIFTFMADTKKMKELKLPLPKTYDDLLKPIYKRKILMEDPRLSTPGLGFITTIQTIYGPNTETYFKNFRSQWLTLTAGWDQAYGLFLKEEAPLVWSYSTSEAYHRENEKNATDKTRYQALSFDDGHIVQIEGAAILKGIRSETLKKCAQDFLSFLISEEAQKNIALKNWMLPVRSDIPLPQSFSQVKHPKKILTPATSSLTPLTVQQTLSTWQTAVESPSTP